MRIAIYVALIIAPFIGYGQETGAIQTDTIIDDGKLKVDKVEVIKAFQAKLSEAKMISIPPTPSVVVPKKKNYEYQITIVPLDIEYPDPEIKPLAMNPSTIDKGKRFYAKLGYGDLNSPFADVSYHGNRGEELDYLIYGNYYGLDDSKTITNRKFQDADLGVNVGYVVNENHKLSINLQGEYDQRFLYDTVFANNVISDTISFKRDQFDISTRITFSNIEPTENDLDYAISLDGGFLSLTRVGLPALTEYRVGVSGTLFKKFRKELAIGIDLTSNIADIEYSSINNPLFHYSTATPIVKGMIGRISYRLGADLFYDDANGFSPFVDAYINIPIVQNALNIVLGADQKVHDNSFHTRFGDNPFVNPLMLLQLNTLRQQVYGGVKGAIKNNVVYEIIGGYETLKNQRLDFNRNGISMDQDFDDGYNIFIEGRLDFKINENFSAGGVVNHNIIELDTYVVPINIPQFSYTTYGKASFWNQRISVGLEAFIKDEISWLSPISGEIQSGNTMLDLNTELNIKIYNSIGLWARVNNILDREYLRYENIPTVGRNILGGIKVVF